MQSIYRFNFTNLDEPYFLVESLDDLNKKMIEENDSLISIVYAVNQKGKSSGVRINQLEIGTNYLNFKGANFYNVFE